jgi:hypothetical protein
MPATTMGKAVALEALASRRANQPKKIDNSSLPAGAPMYFYCLSCGHESDVKPENYLTAPKKLCGECQALRDLGWLE